MYNKGDMTGDTLDGAGKCVNVLAVCFAESAGLGSALLAVLEPVRSVTVTLECLSGDQPGEWAAVLHDLFAKTQPNLLLLSLPREKVAVSEIVFETVRQSRRNIFVIPVLETAALDQLERLIDLGAADFCLAPLRLEDLLPRIIRWSCGSPKKDTLVRQLEKNLGLKQLLGKGRRFLEAVNRIPKLARCDASVLISGETGTGKEMCARAIHHLSPRADQPFIPVNCGAIPLELVENELFGHDAGSFTSAFSTVRGLVHDAEGGTLFLDEIDSLPLPTQVKFLRFLQDHEYRPLGARKAVKADVRVVAASSGNLEESVKSGRFRSDLFYRLNVLPLTLPALRERREDIPLLARHFVDKYARRFSLPPKELSACAVEKLLSYEWPGNIRELENIIERAMVLSEQSVIAGEDISVPAPASAVKVLSFKVLKARAIAEFETSYVQRMLATSDGNISRAARAANKNRRAFWQLMRKHGIDSPGAARIAERLDKSLQQAG